MKKRKLVIFAITLGIGCLFILGMSIKGHTQPQVAKKVITNTHQSNNDEVKDETIKPMNKNEQPEVKAIPTEELTINKSKDVHPETDKASLIDTYYEAWPIAFDEFINIGYSTNKLIGADYLTRNIALRAPDYPADESEIKDRVSKCADYVNNFDTSDGKVVNLLVSINTKACWLN